MKREIELNGRWISYNLEYKRVKNINVRIRPDSGVSVSCGKRVKITEVENFLREKSDFIVNAVNKVKERTVARPIEFVSGEEQQLFGKTFQLIVQSGTKNSVSVSDSIIYLTVTDTNDFDLKNKTYDKWKKQFALVTMTDFCHKLYPEFEKIGIDFPEIKVRNMKSRWGSCHTQKKILTFNTKLLETSPLCIEYVVIHEFTHFIYADHSKNFHNAMTAFLPDWKARRKLLNEQSIY